MVWERQTETIGRRRIQTVLLTQNFFFFWPYHSMLTSKAYVFSSDKTHSIDSRSEAVCFPVTTVLYLPIRLTATSSDSRLKMPNLTWASVYIISLYPHISVQPCDCFCLLSLMQRSSDWLLGQWSIGNILVYLYTHVHTYIWTFIYGQLYIYIYNHAYKTDFPLTLWLSVSLLFLHPSLSIIAFGWSSKHQVAALSWGR